MRQWLPLILLLLATGGLLFFRLGSTTLTNWDEAWFASVARDGLWNGEVWFYEPPLSIWLLRAVMKFWGSRELWLRIPFAVFGVGIVWLTYRLTVYLAGNNLAGMLAGIVLLSDIEFLFRARQINTDIPLTFLLLLTLYAFLQPKKNWWWVGWASWGLAFLTKRATPLLLLPALLLLWWWQRKYIDKDKAWWLMGMVSFAAIVAGWHGYMYYRFGAEFIQKYVVGFTVGKITSVNPATGTDLFMYVNALKHAFKALALVLPLTFVWAVGQWKSWRIVVVVIATFMVMLTVAPIKASWYLLPVHPLFAVIAGSFLAWVLTRRNYFQLPLIVVIVGTVGFQLLHWRNDYIVPDTTGHQAKMARLAGTPAGADKKIYLDDDYLPVAVFYSGSSVVPLRFNRLSIDREKLSVSANHYVLTNRANLPDLILLMPDVDVVSQTGDLLLLKTRLR